MKTTHIASIAALAITTVACGAEDVSDPIGETDASLYTPREEAPSFAAYLFDRAPRVDAQPAFRGAIGPLARAPLGAFALDGKAPPEDEPEPEEEGWSEDEPAPEEEGWSEKESECESITGCGEVPESPFEEACRTELEARVATFMDEGRFKLEMSYEDRCFESRLDGSLAIENPAVNDTHAWGELVGEMHITRSDTPLRTYGTYVFQLEDPTVARIELIVAGPDGYEFGYAHGIAHFDGYSFSHFDMVMDY